MDRLFWAWLSQLWPHWQQALAFVQPHTVITWQHKRFRDYWRRLSQCGTTVVLPLPKRSASSSRICGRTQFNVGLISDRGRTAKVGYRRGQIDGGEVSPERPHTTVTDVESVLNQPREKTWSSAISSPCRPRRSRCCSSLLSWPTSGAASSISTSPSIPRCSGRHSRWSKCIRGIQHPGMCSGIAIVSTARTFGSGYETWASQKC